MLLFIDNYDSFSYNLVQYFQMLGQDVQVYRHDAISIAEIQRLNPEYIVLSPGPCGPDEAGVCMEVIQKLGGVIPILGVCLGHQCIGAAFGGNITKATTLMHGKICPVAHDGNGLFDNLANPLKVTRYNSLTIDPVTLPGCLTVTARDSDDDIMAICHKTLPIYGVQFHPESILSEQGLLLFQNFLNQNKRTAEIKSA